MSLPDLRTKLDRHLSSRYAVLRWRLERVIGCKHHAADALQETWLRLEAMVSPGPTAAPVHHPDAYLLRMAANIASAVDNATGVRVRDCPVSLDELLAKLQVSAGAVQAAQPCCLPYHLPGTYSTMGMYLHETPAVAAGAACRLDRHHRFPDRLAPARLPLQ